MDGYGYSEETQFRSLQENIIRYVDLSIGSYDFTLGIELWIDDDEGAIDFSLWEGSHKVSSVKNWTPSELNRVDSFATPSYPPDLSEVEEMIKDVKESLEDLEENIEEGED